MTGGWRLAARNLRRNRRRNLATGLAVAFGFAGLAVLGGYLDHVDTFLRTNAVYLQHTGHLTVYHAGGLDKAMSKPSRFSLTPAQQAAIRAAASADSRVAFVAGYLRGMGLASNGCRSVPFLALGIEPETQRRILTDANVLQASGDLVRPIRGRQLYEYPDLDGRVALAAGLAGLLGKMRVHDDLAGRAPAVGLPDCSKADAAASFSADANLQLAGITFDGSLAATDSEVVNLFHTPTAETDDQVLYATLPALQRLYDTDAVSYIAVFLKDWRDAAPVAHDLRARLRDAGVPADVYEFTDERVSPYYVGSMVFLRSMGGFIVLIVASVVVLGVMNSTTLTVYERSRELGTLRAVGYTRPQVRGLVIREVALLALLGVCAGIALAYIAAGAVSLADVRINPPGTPGTMRVVLAPGVRVLLWLVALLVPLSLAVAWAVAGRRLRERTSDLLIATNV